MHALIMPTIFGLLAVDEADHFLSLGLSHLSPKELAETYISISQGQSTPAIQEFCNLLKNQGVTEVEVEDTAYIAVLAPLNLFPVQTCEDLDRLKRIREILIQYFLSAKIQFSAKELPERSKVLSEYLLKFQISEVASHKDLQIKNAVDTIVDIDRSVNFLSTRLREWYGLHFPELTDKLIADQNEFAELIIQIGNRDQFTQEILNAHFKFDERKAKIIEEKASRSMGGSLSPIDLQSLQTIAQQVVGLMSTRTNLEKYIAESLEEVTPNLKCVLGAAIASKLIAIAGGLEPLAMMSSSTIQMLGAEKALFKAIRSGGMKTPKHGIIFQWNKIRGEKPHLRGKIARMAAGKISILARVDFYHGDFIGPSIKEEIERKIELLKSQFPKAPEKKESPELKSKMGKKRKSSSFRRESRQNESRRYHK